MDRDTVSLGRGAQQGRQFDRQRELQRVYQDALAAGLGEEGARAAVAIAQTEGGMGGAVGDLDEGGSYGTFQFFRGAGNRKGQLWNYAAAMGISVDEAARRLRADPHAGNQWAFSTYLGGAIRRGLQQGLRGPQLATFAQKTGQVSVSPERAGQNYSALFAGGDRMGVQGGPKVQARVTEQTAGGQMEPQTGRPTAEREKLLEQQRADLATKQAALTAAQAELAQAEADAGQTDDGELNLEGRKKVPGLKAKVSGLQSQVRAAEATVARTSGQIATAKDAPPGTPASQKPSVSTGAGTREKKVLITKADGSTEWIDNPNYVDPGTEAMTPAQAAADSRQGENIDLGWANNALGWVREQIARGTLDFNRGKQFVDYILKDQGPVEENGKLYQTGLNPEHPDVKFFGLTPREYKAIDYAKALGDPSLNQAVRSNDYAFGNAGITPQQWKERSFGLEAQAQMPAQTGEQPAPELPQKGFIPGGGAQPQAPTFGREGDPMRPQGETPAAFAPAATVGSAEGDPMRPNGATPTFGAMAGLQSAVDAEIARTRDHLIKLGTSPQIAEQAARQFFMRQGAT